MKLIDEVKIYIKSGDGGPGCVSFRREKFIEYGGPDGGNGGKGGDVIIRTNPHLNTLIDFRFKQHFKAKNGEHGSGRNRSGKSRDPIILEVPVGTQIYDEDGEEIIFDLDEAGKEYIIAKGGKGGLGNAHFKSATNQAPSNFTPGYPGEEKWIRLKLKLLCDVGLVGLPNAGKSSILSRVSRARPKIADYPFTTLRPQLGVVYVDYNEFVMADIPGLIEGAHKGVGLGDKFLKHVERSKILLHVIDVTTEDIISSYNTIREELKSYSAALADKEEIIAFNKCDAILEDELEEKITMFQKQLGKEVYLISAVTGQNIDQLMRILNNKIKDTHV